MICFIFFSVSALPQCDGAGDDSDDESMEWVEVESNRELIIISVTR